MFPLPVSSSSLNFFLTEIDVFIICYRTLRLHFFILDALPSSYIPLSPLRLVLQVSVRQSSIPISSAYLWYLRRRDSVCVRFPNPHRNLPPRRA